MTSLKKFGLWVGFETKKKRKRKFELRFWHLKQKPTQIVNKNHKLSEHWLILVKIWTQVKAISTWTGDFFLEN